jgi:multidrug transporter EmrE-like cation transporter
MSSLLHSVRIPLLVLLYQGLVVVANVGFKRSAESTTATAFLAWQVLGNLAGFLSVLTYTALLRWLPVHVAVGLTMGLGFASVQVFTAWLIFHEPIGWSKWLGTALVVLGITLIAGGR